MTSLLEDLNDVELCLTSKVRNTRLDIRHTYSKRDYPSHIFKSEAIRFLNDHDTQEDECDFYFKLDSVDHLIHLLRIIFEEHPELYVIDSRV